MQLPRQDFGLLGSIDMKKQLKKILPCIMAGITGISYGNTNSKDDTDNLIKISENENKIAENLKAKSSSEKLISDNSISEKRNFSRIVILTLKKKIMMILIEYRLIWNIWEDFQKNIRILTIKL